jgi:ABC-type nitrate/sulfonate/bicarbonate transport system substrate-binding protein
MDRRAFLRRLGAAGAGMAMGGLSLAPCARAQGSSLGRITYQLGWIKNFQFTGEYVADYKKYYQEFGIEVDLLSGGPTVNVEPTIVSGKALLGQSMPDLLANANAKGAALKCFAACYQRNVSTIISLAKSPLTTPSAMIGKRIGIQINNLVIWHSFLKLNKIDPASIRTVPVQFDFTPLVSGEVDGFFGEVIDDAVQLTTRGIEIHCLLFADFGYNMLTAVYETAADSLTDRKKRAQLVAFMKGDLLGWRDAIRDPSLAARLTVDVYGRGNGLEYENQRASCVVANDFIESADTRKHGLFWMSPQNIDQTISSLAAAGVRATPDMFTNEILEEAYEGIKAL